MLITVTCKLIGYLVHADDCNLQADWIKLMTVILLVDWIKMYYLQADLKTVWIWRTNGSYYHFKTIIEIHALKSLSHNFY